jgi:hypothetical protein
MGRYDFHSTGAAVSGALEQFLTEQKAEQRQAMLDELNKQNVQSQMADRVMNRKIQEEGIQASVAQRAALADTLATGQAQKIAEMTRQGTDLTPDTKATLVKGHLGHLVQDPTIKQVEAVPSTAVSPDMLNAGVSLPPSKFGGTVKQDEFDQQQAMKAYTAELVAEGKRQTAAIQQAALEGRISHQQEMLELSKANLAMHERMSVFAEQMAQDKHDAAKKLVTDKATAVKIDRTELRNLAKEIYDNPNLGDVVGPIVGGIPSVKSSSVALDGKIQELIDKLKVGARERIKGQGSISDIETKMLGNAATWLNSSGKRASVTDFKKEIKRILDATHGDTIQEGIVPGYNTEGDTLPDVSPAVDALWNKH